MNPRVIIERLQDYLNHIRASWYKILLSFLIFTALLVANSATRPTYYTATTVFHPDAERNVNSAQDGLSFLFGGVDPTDSEMTYMTGLLNSKTLNRSVVQDSVVFEEEKHLVADLILAYNPPYKSLISYFGSLFKDSADYASISLEKKTRWASTILLNSMELETNPNTGFAELSVHYYQPELAGLLCERYLSQLKHYYSRQKSVRTQQSIEFFSYRADSIKQELDRVNRALASDQNRRPYRIFAEDDIYPTELESQQSILSQMFVSLYISQEQAKAQQQRELPVVQVIDPPLAPYPPTKPNYALYGAVGAIVGIFLGIFLVCLPMLRADVTFLFNEFVVKPIMQEPKPASPKDTNTDEGS